MQKKMILNDLKANKLNAIATAVFMCICAMMIGLFALLFSSLLTSIDRLMETAQTPHFLQMHAGEIDEDAILSFAQENGQVESYQICGFLNLENGELSIGDASLAESSQDNGLAVQNKYFDFMVDLQGQVISVNPGEVYVPVCYKSEYGVKVGDTFKVASYELEVAGFLRDSQMNSMMASSKRFLVNEEDYNRFKPAVESDGTKSSGEEEYLIEFRLKDGADVNAFSTEYSMARLPENGPTITYSLIKMMNALSDGMMILVILLVGVVLLFISILCIRFLLLTELEKDKREIGMMKAIGISIKDIKSTYMTKYALISLVSGLVGMLAVGGISIPLQKQMSELYGLPDRMGLIYLVAILGVCLVEAIILLSVRKILNKMRKLSTIEALYGLGKDDKFGNKYIFISLITAAALALMIIPQNMASTLSSPKFVTNMGIGDSQIRIDIRQVDNIDEIEKEIVDKLDNDSRVSGYVVMKSGSYQAKLSGDSSYKLLIERGDHSKYPVTYSQGSYPVNDNQIALSKLNAKELSLNVGDTISINDNDYTVCGIYSDITNGGKTAKACFEDSETPLMWSIIYLNLEDESLIESWVDEMKLPGCKVTDISGYVQATYGRTIDNIESAAVLSALAALVVLFVVILLFVRMIIWQERNNCSFKKALGFTSGDILVEYLKKTLLYISVGLLLGIFIGLVPGEGLAGKLLGSLGASDFNFIINPLWALVVSPIGVVAVAMFAAKIGLKEVNKISPHECCNVRN